MVSANKVRECSYYLSSAAPLTSLPGSGFCGGGSGIKGDAVNLVLSRTIMITCLWDKLVFSEMQCRLGHW